jgi:transposase
MEKEEQRFVMKFIWLKGWGAKRIHEELISTLGDDSYTVSQSKIWLQTFRNGELSCKDSPRSGRPFLTLESQLEAFMQKCPFASARVIAQHFLTTIATIKNILQRELEMRNISRRWVPHFLSPAQKVTCVEASKQYYLFYKTRNQTILKELQRVMSPSSGTVTVFNNVCAGAIRGYSKDAANNWRGKNNDNDFLHCTTTNPVECTTKKK